TNADPITPVDLLEARNAVAIARAEGAQQYAPDALHKAEDFLNRGEDYLRGKQSGKAQQAQLAAQQAEQARLQAEQQAQQTRERLLQQLNDVLQTKETARGLIVNMPDVLFDTGQHTLKAGARERLAKVAGILLAYPNLHVQVEGHTDNVGG